MDVERAFEIDRQHLPPKLGVGIQNVADPPDASAIDQPVQLSEPSHRFGHKRGNVRAIRNVDRYADNPVAVPELRHDSIDLFFSHIRGGDRCTFLE